MMYSDKASLDMKARVKDLAAELRRRGFHGQALQDELDRRFEGHKKRLAEVNAGTKAARATTIKAADTALDRFWADWANGGRDEILRECERAGV
jgi:hypothetical protein